ncbi:hypothetical protein DC915_RS02585 [Vibrio parahaemolyticus]|nr:hypothetical protein [Vibrio parahaemolyticus]EJG0009864.1 hypothetical protein [Vibrio parahaemolyticus]
MKQSDFPTPMFNLSGLYKHSEFPHINTKSLEALAALLFKSKPHEYLVVSKWLCDNIQTQEEIDSLVHSIEPLTVPIGTTTAHNIEASLVLLEYVRNNFNPRCLGLFHLHSVKFMRQEFSAAHCVASCLEDFIVPVSKLNYPSLVDLFNELSRIILATYNDPQRLSLSLYLRLEALCICIGNLYSPKSSANKMLNSAYSVRLHKGSGRIELVKELLKQTNQVLEKSFLQDIHVN